MIEALRIDPTAIFDDRALREALGVSASALAEARKRGQIRATRKGGKFFYVGRWVQDWIEAAEPEGVALSRTSDTTPEFSSLV